MADDQPGVLARVAGLLGTHHEVVAAVGDGFSAVREARRLRPDIAIIDLSMPGLSGFDTAERIARDGRAVRIVILTSFDDDDLVEIAQQIGLDGYVLKTAMATQLLPTLARVMAGERVFPAVSRHARSTR